MKAKVYNLEGKETGEINLAENVFNIKINPSVVHEVFISQTANQREPWADTKSKGDVRGGGRKPWQQKGTGRARHGSIRSPIWKGGGVVFGPRNDRNYKVKINKNTRRLVIRMCLSDRALNNALLIVENFDFSEPKTKLFNDFIKQAPLKAKKYLVLSPAKDNKLLRMTDNLKSIKVIRAEDANVIDLLSWPAIITSQAGIEKLTEIFNKK